METNDVDREDDAPAVTVTVVYHSVHGHTRVLAEHLADGARLEPGTEAFGANASAAELRAMLDRFPRVPEMAQSS